MQMHAILVGLGSVGQRHVRILRDLGVATSTVSRRPGLADFCRIEDAATAYPDALLVIANETASHIETLLLARSSGHRGPIVVEKPLGCCPDELLGIDATDNIWVAYNLRFAPVVTALRTALAESAGSVVAVNMHVGQHLSTWRPGTQVHESYSAHKARGGGALRDLSHELDLLVWLWGRVSGLCALGGRRASVTVDSDDCWTMILKTSRGVDVGLSLNYLDHPPIRFIHVVTSKSTLRVDLINSVVYRDGVGMEVPSDRDASYRAMWAHFLGTEVREEGQACTFAEGAEIVRLVGDCERSARELCWIGR